MKKIIIALFALFMSINMSAQIYDGKLPGTRWRVFLPMQTSYEGHAPHTVTAAPQLMFRQDLTKWLALEAVATYNINSESFMPKLWLGFSLGNVWIIQRNNYNCKTDDFSTGLSGTWKVKNYGIDFTWDNIYAFKKWCNEDRLQFVATYATPNNKWNFNAGYSCRFKKGVIANVRYNIKDGIRLQGKFDGGAKNVQASFIWDFN